MKGLRGASRPQRQARSGVTYKESDDEDEEFVPNARISSDIAGRRSSLRNSVAEGEELGITKGRRTLTLKRARTLEPPVSVAKENIAVYANTETAPEEKSVPSPTHELQYLQVVESAEDMPNLRRESSAFQYLLEAVSGASGDGEEEGASTVLHPCAPKITDQFERREQEEEMTSAAYGPELLAAYAAYERKLLDMKGVKEEYTEGTYALGRLAHSSDEESKLVNSSKDKGMKDTVETERGSKDELDGMSSADEKKYRRRGDKAKQVNMPSADGKEEGKKGGEDKQDNVPSVDGKNDSKKGEGVKHVSFADAMKDRKRDEEDNQNNVSSADGKTASKKGEADKRYIMSSADEDEEDEDAEDSWNECSDASDSENKSPIKEQSDTPAPAKKPSQNLKTFAKRTNVLKKNPGTAGRVLMPIKPTSVPSLLPKKRPAVWVGSKPFVSPVPAPLNLPSPTVAHRRVVGLSRRHRPPPLHPYLLGS